MRKNLPLLVLVVVVALVIGGYLGYTSLTEKEPPLTVRNVKKAPAQIVGDTLSDEVNSPDDREKNVSPKTMEETNVAPTNPDAGELMVYGVVKAVDIDRRILTIDQQMDDNSVEVGPNVPVNKDAIIRSKEEVISLTRIKPGDSVGIIVTKDGQARAVLVNY